MRILLQIAIIYFKVMHRQNLEMFPLFTVHPLINRMCAIFKFRSLQWTVPHSGFSSTTKSVTRLNGSCPTRCCVLHPCPISKLLANVLSPLLVVPPERRENIEPGYRM